MTVRLTHAEIINDYIIVHLTGVGLLLTENIMGLVDDLDSPRLFRVIDVFERGQERIVQIRLCDKKLDIPLSRMEYHIVKKLYNQVHPSLVHEWTG